MLPSVTPSWLNASRHSTCIHSDYTTIAKLILCASNRVNDRPHRRDLRLGRSSRVMRGHFAPCWIKRERSSHVVRRRIRRWKPSHPLARLTAWWISQSQQQGARFWTGTHAERRGMGATYCSRNGRLWNGRPCCTSTKPPRRAGHFNAFAEQWSFLPVLHCWRRSWS
jgi:hypothetical protein